MSTPSSVPNYTLEARKALEDAATVLQGNVSSAEVARAQALATLGVGYSILAVFQQLPNLQQLS